MEDKKINAILYDVGKAVYLKPPYSKEFNDECMAVGGRWNEDYECWEIKDKQNSPADLAIDLLHKYFKSYDISYAEVVEIEPGFKF